jgi:hypothetical protein
MAMLDAADIVSLVRREIETIVDPVVRDALTSRVLEPRSHLREWDYGDPGERYPCWTIVEDATSDTAIVYSAFGHGPRDPWGLVAMSALWFGMDGGWYARLEDAFVESHMARALRIWDVVAPSGAVLLSSLSLHEAFAERDRIDAGLVKPVHHVLYRSRSPDGVP